MRLEPGRFPDIRFFMDAKVAIIDVGSNSIKLLVACAAETGGVATVHSRTMDTRISRGISRTPPRLGEEGMKAGLDAILRLRDEARVFGATRIEAVATSAVRDAENGAEFRSRVADKAGLPLRILSGEEEARYIGRGLAADPALAHLHDFYVFDLGGGSLECLSFKAREVAQAISLPLGCVRLTERFVANPAIPIDDAVRATIQKHVALELKASGFRFDLEHPEAVFAGGTMTTTRAILAASEGKALEGIGPGISVETLSELAAKACSLPQEERPRVLLGLPVSRADVFPAALLTAISVARCSGASRFLHSLHNLRYGLAAELLSGGGQR